MFLSVHRSAGWKIRHRKPLHTSVVIGALPMGDSTRMAALRYGGISISEHSYDVADYSTILIPTLGASYAVM